MTSILNQKKILDFFPQKNDALAGFEPGSPGGLSRGSKEPDTLGCLATNPFPPKKTQSSGLLEILKNRNVFVID